MVELLDFNKEHLDPNRSIIVIDEENQTVWLWHGKLRGLVPRRTALRQAQSLKGHGYQAGNAIVGRDLNKIVEIDARKIGRVPETTEANEKFMSILNRDYKDIGNNVYVVEEKFDKSKMTERMKSVQEDESEEPEKATLEAPKVSTGEPKPKSPELPPDKPVSVPESKPKYPLKHVEMGSKGSAIEDKVGKGFAKDSQAIKTAVPIIAVLEQYKDIWISRKENGVIAIEQMDGKICSFSIDNGELVFQTGSFAEISPDKKKAIQNRVKELL